MKGFFSAWQRGLANAVAASKNRASPRTAQKQQLRRRQKVALARVREANSSTTGVNLRDALTTALFTVTNPNYSLSTSSDTNNDATTTTTTLKERALISRVWSQTQMLQIHERSSWERNYLQAKLEASQELRKVSLSLADAANRIDYSIPPLHRRLPTDTPPDPAKFPFKMSINSEGVDAGSQCETNIKSL